VIVVAIEAQQHMKQRVSSALGVDIAQSSILFIVQFEVRIVGMFVG
jgi:hypothetical protein